MNPSARAYSRTTHTHAAGSSAWASASVVATDWIAPSVPSPAIRARSSAGTSVLAALPMRMASPGSWLSRSRQMPSMMAGFDRACGPYWATAASSARRAWPAGSMTCPFPSVTKDPPHGAFSAIVTGQSAVRLSPPAPFPAAVRSPFQHRVGAEQEVPEVPELALDVGRGDHVTGERVDRYVLARGDLVVRREYRGRRADRVHQSGTEQAPRGNPAGQQRAVYVAQGVERRRDQVDVMGEELGHFDVGRVRRQRDGPLDVAEERHVGVTDRDPPAAPARRWPARARRPG